jgi:hypothetical protein
MKQLGYLINGIEFIPQHIADKYIPFGQYPDQTIEVVWSLDDEQDSNHAGGNRIIRELDRGALESWAAADAAPDWWDFQSHSLLCPTGTGFVHLSVPEILVVDDVMRYGVSTPMARIYGCDSPISADSYWSFIPVLVLEDPRA